MSEKKDVVLTGFEASALANVPTVETTDGWAHGAPGAALTQLVKLFPHAGAPIVRALVVDRTTRQHTQVHFECATDGTLLVRISDA